MVAERDDVADGVVALTLRDAAGAPLPGWGPGAHVDLLLPVGPRQFSLCGDPADDGSWRIGVLREPAGRGGSAYVHHALFAGTEVDVHGPRNHFALEPASRYRFIVGGIGITPILPMIRAAQEAGADWTLLYGGRRRESMAFLDDLAAHGDAVRPWPQDEHGLLDLDAELGTPDPETLVYCCGPEPLLEAVEERCAAWPADHLRVERFFARPIDADAAEDVAFEVVLERSGLALSIEPGTSILDACEDAGVDVRCSCEEGICGTCETDVLEGTPDHRDSVLTEAEREAGEVMMICVSRARTPRLVLDL